MTPTATARALIVSGDFEFCDSLADAMQEQGYEVEFAYDGETAAELSSGRDFELVLVDHWPPYLNAASLAPRLKQSTRQATVVSLCNAGNESVRPALQAASDFVLNRGNDAQGIVAAVKQLGVPRPAFLRRAPRNVASR